MGIEQIVARIIDEAREKASAIRSEANDKVAASQSKWNDEQAVIERETRDAIALAARRERDRIVTTEELEARKRRLAMKRRVLDKAFDAARKAFLDVAPDEYETLLVNLVVEGTLEGDEAILLGKRDHEALGERIVQRANQRLSKEGRRAELSLGDVLEVEAGVILARDRVQVCRTLDDIIAETRERLEGRVAAILFEDEA